MKKEMVIISTKEKSLVSLIFAAMFYAVSFFSLGLSFYYEESYEYLFFVDANNQSTLEEWLIITRAILFALIALPMVAGVRLSQKRTLFFDLEKERYKNQLSLGPFKTGKWKYLPSLKYISVIGVYSFSINLWYGKNQHINLFAFWGKEKTFRKAFEIADQLNIKLLDATREDYKYLNMEELRKKYKPKPS